jgi:uncharacterized protein (DUF488 family)
MVYDPMKPKIYTIGHSNSESTQLFTRLKQYGIDILIDIRSKPYSKYTPQYNTESIKRACIHNGIKYYYLGSLLGGKPDDASILNDAGEIDYTLLSQKEYFVSGINNLLHLISKSNACLMCSEGRPDKCHRNLLVAPALNHYGVDVLHILPDGTTIDSEALSLLNNKGQLVLF